MEVWNLMKIPELPPSNLFPEFLTTLHVLTRRPPPLASSLQMPSLLFQPESVLYITTFKDSSLQTSPEITQYSFVMKRYFIFISILVMGAYL